MKIYDVIEKIKKYHKGYGNIDPNNTRDKVLFGNTKQECTGIVTTCWATVNVIKKAIELNANLIICHEALFWNHGDHTDWLENTQNKTYLKKKKLLEENGIVVWRNHDYIHSGIPIGKNQYTDGIFYGFAKKIGWDKYINDLDEPLLFKIPAISIKEIANLLIEKLHLNGLRILGSTDVIVKNVYICLHVMGNNKELITKVDGEDIDLLLPLELIDYTLSEYIRDSDMVKEKKAIISMGHFNIEEPGMEYMIEYLPDILNDKISCYYVQSGDMYQYFCKK